MKKILLFIFIGTAAISFVPVDTVVAQEGLSQMSQCSGTDCSACNIVHMANGIIKWLIGILFVIFAILVAVAGVKLVVSGGNHHALDEAKGMFLNAIIGFIIILSAWLIVDTIMRTLVGTADKPGQLAMGGTATGYLFWSQVQCQRVYTPEDNGQVVLSLETELQEVLTSGCMAQGMSVAELQALGCRFNPCTATSCLTSCMNLVKGTEVGLSDSNNYCASGVVGEGTSATPVSESGMISLRSLGVVVASWNGIDGPGRTDKAHPSAANAALRMQNSGKAKYGKQPFQVTAAYTRNVGHSANSQHYNGVAIDFQPSNGVTYAQIAALAKEAGFTFVLIEASSRHVHADMR